MAEYTTGTWKDKVNYLCSHCPFSTLHEEVIQKHNAKFHQPSRRPTGLVDGSGNDLMVEVEVEPEPTAEVPSEEEGEVE